MADDENEANEMNVQDKNMKDSISNSEKESKEVKNYVPEPKANKGESNIIEDKHEEKKDDESEEEEEDEVEQEELPPGLLEQPLEIEGKRQKKKVERLAATMMRATTEKPPIEIEEGSGTKLNDIPYVAHYINVTKASDLKSLHRLLFLRLGAMNEIKRNIRKFSGITEAKDSKEHEKRLSIITRMNSPELKHISLWLGLKQSGNKSELIERLMTYLEKPEDQGLEVKKKRNRSKTPAKKGTKRKRKTKKTETKENPKKKMVKKNKTKQDTDEEEEQEEESAEDNEEETEDEAPKKKKPKLEVKKKDEKKTPKKAVKENGKKEKGTLKKAKAPPQKKATPTKQKSPEKETKKKSPTNKQVTTELSDSLSDDSPDSDEEPLLKIPKPPSDEEIKNAVKNILDGADLETVTMKTVVKQVFAKYPKFDLSDRKDFIKSTVREVIS